MRREVCIGRFVESYHLFLSSEWNFYYPPAAIKITEEEDVFLKVIRLNCLERFLSDKYTDATNVMGRACCVLGCPSGGDAPSHQIPKNPVLFQKWKNMIYSEKIQHLTDEQISKCAVCYRHFADDDYLVTFRVRKLKRGIAPSLNLPNKLAANNRKPDIVKIESETEMETSDADASMFLENLKTESQEAETEVPEIALFEDIPEEAESYFHKQLQQIPPDEPNVKQTDSTAEAFKLCRRKRALRRKRRKLMAEKLVLLRLKKQAEQYEKTPTIQKLLSFLTPAEIALVKAKIRTSKYSPRVFVRVYYDIARKKALGQS
ncbi:thap domain-containing protein 9 [Lasius niger]|uniref:Thap domain-containing protein 9 n=1 Tax=Lasius niger TaxID=67767 RepID=A0A0J7L6A8_LASNI|nr:thap domain-containing protein 9 [Lasius niger]